MRSLGFFYCSLLVLIVGITSCDSPTQSTSNVPSEDAPTVEEPSESIIDLSHWKVTLPIGNPTEVVPPEIFNFENIDIVKPYMFNDDQEDAIVFYTQPGSTTQNSRYSRTELREQMVPGSNKTNWTFEEGGRLKGSLRLDEVSTQSNGNFDRVIVMQIHGRLTDEQRGEINEDDNNAPPVLKIYWIDGRIRVHRKILKDVNVGYPMILKTDAWTDETHWLPGRVDYEKFSLEVTVNGSRMQIDFNGQEELVFDDIHTERWGIFENYFKAGNYLLSTDPEAFSRVKYYDLEVSH